jgi:uncharacterized protein (TIGR02145 family)
MCHNLGADETYDPFTPSAQIHGDKYKWGVSEATLPMLEDQNPDKIFLPNGWWEGKTYQSSGTLWSSDPCPAGWRLPSHAECANVINGSNNLLTRMPDDPTKWEANPTNYKTGLKIGDALFLSTNGHRATNGELIDMGNAHYWTSNANSAYGYSWYFSYTIYGTCNCHDRRFGFNVRCVAN